MNYFPKRFAGCCYVSRLKPPFPCHRCLKPTTVGSDRYEILDNDKSVRKCHDALRHCRTKIAIGNDAFDATAFAGATSDSFFPQTTKPSSSTQPSSTKPASTKVTTKPPPKKKQKTGGKKKSAAPLIEKNFDDVAKAAISTLLSQQELVNAMETNWGSQLEKRKQIFEDQVSVKVCFLGTLSEHCHPTHVLICINAQSS